MNLESSEGLHLYCYSKFLLLYIHAGALYLNSYDTLDDVGKYQCYFAFFK